MSTNHHTPYDGTTYHNKASDMNVPLAELDQVITDNADDIDTNVTDISDLQTQPYDIPIMYNGSPTNALVMLRIEMVRAVTYPAGLTLSRLKALIAATAESIFSLKKNGSEFGTMTFAISGTTATVAAASETVFAAGNILTLVAPATADVTLADLYGMIVGSR